MDVAHCPCLCRWNWGPDDLPHLDIDVTLGATLRHVHCYSNHCLTHQFVLKPCTFNKTIYLHQQLPRIITMDIHGPIVFSATVHHDVQAGHAVDMDDHGDCEDETCSVRLLQRQDWRLSGLVIWDGEKAGETPSKAMKHHWFSRWQTFGE